MSRLGARFLLRTLRGAAAAYSPPDLGRKESLVAYLTGCEVTHRAATGRGPTSLLNRVYSLLRYSLDLHRGDEAAGEAGDDVDGDADTNTARRC